MTDEPAHLACRCGQCRITLADPEMRYRTECLCVDCRQRGLISASRAPGNALPTAVAAYERGVDLYYFTNVLEVDDASFALLEFSKLRPDADNTTCMSTCCGTLMCGVHPIYGGNTISVNADSCRVTVSSVMPSRLICFGADIPTEKCEAIRQRDPRPLVMSLAAEIDTPPVVDALTRLCAPIPERLRGRGRSFEALCVEKGDVVIDDAFFEESRVGQPRPPASSIAREPGEARVDPGVQ
jgi:hypothetical protein